MDKKYLWYGAAILALLYARNSGLLAGLFPKIMNPATGSDDPRKYFVKGDEI